MFSYASVINRDPNTLHIEQQPSILSTFVHSSRCLTPCPEHHFFSHIISRIELAEYPQQREEYWKLLVRAFAFSSQTITPVLCSHISKLAARDVQVSPACVSAIEYMVERFVKDDVSFAASLLPALATAHPSARLLRIIRSFSAVRHDHQSRFHILLNLQVLLTSPLWKKHLIHLRPLLPTYPYPANFVECLIESPQSYFTVPFLFQVTPQSDLPCLLQQLLAIMLDRLSTLLSTEHLTSHRSSFSRYISTLAVIFRLGTSHLSSITTPNSQKKRRVSPATKSPSQRDAFQMLFCVLENSFSQFSSTPHHATLVTNVSLCIQYMLRNCFAAVKSRVPYLLDALVSALSSSRGNCHGIHHAILTDLVSAYSRLGSLSTLFTLFSSRFALKPFQLYAKSIICTPRFSLDLAKCAAGLSLEDASRCIRALTPAFQNLKDTSALLSIRLVCVITESLMKGSFADITGCVLKSSSVLLENTTFQYTHVYWYFLSSLLILSSRGGSTAITNLLGLLNAKGNLKITRPAKKIGMTNENCEDAEVSLNSSGTVDPDFISLVSHLNKQTPKFTDPVEIACFIRLLSVMFQILVDITRNNRLLLVRIGSDLLRKILNSYRGMCEESYELANVDELSPLWNGSAMDFTSGMLSALSGPVDQYLDQEYDDVFKHLFKNLAHCSYIKEDQWGALMKKECFLRGARLGICEIFEKLCCGENTCGDGCKNFRLLVTIGRLRPYFNDEISGRLRHQLTRSRVKVKCEESRSIIWRLSSKLEGEGGDDTTEFLCQHAESELRGQCEVNLETKTMMWEIIKVLIMPYTQALLTEEVRADDNCADFFEELCVRNGMAGDNACETAVQGISDIANAILKKISRQKHMSDPLVIAGTEGCLSDQRTRLIRLKEISRRVCCKQDLRDDSSGLAAKLLTAYIVPRSDLKGGEEITNKVLDIPGDNGDAELFAKYAIQRITYFVNSSSTVSSLLPDHHLNREVLALCHAIVKCSEHSKLDGDIQVNMICHMLYVVRQAMAVPNENRMELCCDAVRALEQILNQLCRAGDRESGPRPSESAWRNLTIALGGVVEAGMSRARFDGWKMCGYEVKCSQQIAATLVNACIPLLHYGAGGRWFVTETCCAAMRYANTMGGQACNEAVGHALEAIEWCRQHGMMTNERMAKLIMVGADAGASETVVGALGSLLLRLPCETVSTLLRKASPQAIETLNLAQNRNIKRSCA